MLRKTLTILSLLGLLLSVGLWGVTGRLRLGYIPESRTCKIGFAFGAFTVLRPDEPFVEVAGGSSSRPRGSRRMPKNLVVQIIIGFSTGT